MQVRGDPDGVSPGRRTTRLIGSCGWASTRVPVFRSDTGLRTCRPRVTASPRRRWRRTRRRAEPPCLRVPPMTRTSQKSPQNRISRRRRRCSARCLGRSGTRFAGNGGTRTAAAPQRYALLAQCALVRRCRDHLRFPIDSAARLEPAGVSLYDIGMVSEDQIQEWADEAEAGYDVEELKRRGRGRPGRGAEPMQVVAVRLTAEELDALDAAAAKSDMSRSEAIRAALAHFAA